MSLLKALYQNLNKKTAFKIGLTLILVIVLEILGTLYIPVWREGFYNVLQGRIAEEYAGVLFQFFILMFGLGVVQGLKTWISILFGMEWRKAAAELWTKLQKDNTPVNSTQVYTESLRQATEQYITVGMELVISFVIVVALIASNISNPLIVGAAIIYSLLIIAVTSLFNKPLTYTDKAKQEADGELRELIAQNTSKLTVLNTFYTNLGVYSKYVRTQMYFTLYGRLKGSLATLIPYILLAAPYFSEQITFGQFMSQGATFELIAINMTIMVIMYPALTTARASWKIVSEYYNKNLTNKVE